MKRGRLLAAALCTCFVLTGCSSFSPEISGIRIDKKGGVTEVIRENFGESYYSEEELKTRLASEVESYNSQAGDKAAKSRGLKVKNGVAELTMVYASTGDYASFNQVDFYGGDVIGAIQAGYMFEGSFKTVSGGKVNEESAVWGSEIISGTNYKTVVLEGPLLVEVPGSIVYVSENVKVTDKSTAVTDESERAYILYE